MASAITHFIVGAGLSLPAMEAASLRRVLPRWAIPVTAGLFAVAPDLDTYAMFAFHIPRGSLFNHRGFFHSPFFLSLFAFGIAAAVARGRSWLALSVLWTCAAITHPLLDMLTDGGSGVMLLFPITTDRYFFPWRPIRVSPLGIARFFDRAGVILASEMPFDLVALAIGGIALALSSRHPRKA
jgi:inner membrane protein